ncbi:MAG TPA: nitroreductase family deazaflavin-dependent oxidoreductase [Microbacterium sp.]|nr:nitroreductase family deazaflavin-dependent oxidoreductase [Microbacterium sp.]
MAKNLGHRLLNRLHHAVLAITRGRAGWTLGSMPVVELHTVGRRTGQRRSAMLTAPVHGDGRYVLVASKGGDPRHPEWYLNLLEHPDVELTVRGSTIPMRARTATPEERAELWPDITREYRGYAGYQRRTTREIPVVICEARPSHAA